MKTSSVFIVFSFLLAKAESLTVTYQYFKLNCLGTIADGNTGWAMAELVFFDEDNSVIPATSAECGSPPCCTAESTNTPSQKCERMFDGEMGQTTNCYLNDLSKPTGWVTYDFGSAKTVSAYMLYRHVDRVPHSWTLEGSNDGSTWTLISSVTSFDWFQSAITYPFPYDFRMSVQVKLPQKLPELRLQFYWPEDGVAQNCSIDDNCRYCRDGAVVVPHPDHAGKLVYGGGHCMLNSTNVCVDIYTHLPCSSDISACPPHDVHSTVEGEYLEPAWYQVCADDKRNYVMGPAGCNGGVDSVGFCEGD